MLKKGSIARIKKESTPEIFIMVINYPKQIYLFFFTINEQIDMAIKEQVRD